MKKVLLYFFLIVFTLTVFTSCRPDNEEVVSNAEGSHNNRVYSVTFSGNQPGYSPDEKKQEVTLPDIMFLPETKESIVFPEIGCPEGYYLYCIPGQYMDAERNPVTLEFVKEYVLTDKVVSEEKLIKDIRDAAGISEERDPERRGPGYILFSYNVFHRDYLPIECLYESILKSSNEYRYMGDKLYCEIGTTIWRKASEGGKNYYICIDPYDPDEEVANVRIDEDKWPVDELFENLNKNTEENGILYENEAGPGAYQSGFLMYGEKPLFRGYTSSIYHKYDKVYGQYIGDPDRSPVNNKWWEAYQEALSALEGSRSEYSYPEVKMEFTHTAESQADEAYASYEKELAEGWYQDADKDHKLRAYIYANLKNEKGCQLEDVMIFLKDIGIGHRLFIAGICDQASGTITVVDKGADLISEINMDFSEKYCDEYLRTVR